MAHTRARPDWIDYPSTSTLVREVDLDKWDNDIHDLRNIVRYDSDYTSVQAALDDMTAGGTLYLTSQSYASSNWTTTARNIRIVGLGGVGQNTVVGAGYTQVNVAAGTTGFTFNPSAASTIFEGPMLENIHFVGSATATGAVKLNRCNNFLLTNVGASNFPAGFGIYSDGTGNVNQYGVLVNPSLNDCQIGLDCKLTNGLRVVGGMIDSNANSGAVAAGTTGIRLQSGDTFRAFGTVMQFAETCANVQSGANHSEFIGCRFEGFTTGLSLASNYNLVSGGDFVNSILGSTTGTAINITAGTQNTLYPGAMLSVTNRIVDSGTDTVYIDPVGNFLHLGDGMNVFKAGTGTWRLQDNLHVELNLVVDRVGSGNRIVLGGTSIVNNVTISYGTGSPESVVTAHIGSLYLRSDGGASTTLYVKQSGTGNTGWVAK